MSADLGLDDAKIQISFGINMENEEKYSILTY
jgi:hypothetical protein